MSKLGIANGASPGLGVMRYGHHDGGTEQHRNSLVKKRSYGSLERVAGAGETLKDAQAADLRNAGT